MNEHSTNTDTPLLRLKGVTRAYQAGDQTLVVLKGIDLTIERGELVAIVGASGSGKSTLMNILGCLDKPTSGTYEVLGRDTREMDPDELAALRREMFGFIFQKYHLLASLDAVDNVAIPAVYAGWSAQRREERAEQLLERLGLGDRMTHRPNELSGGQQQRVGVARALMNGGQVIFADEPTGALDKKSGAELLELLGSLHDEGHTIIMVTHDREIAQHAQRIIEIDDGNIVSDTRRAPVQRSSPSAQTGRASGDASSRPGAFARLFARARQYAEAFRMAVVALASHRLRTFLTMLGIIIGIASVVSVVALGKGSQENILQNISALGTNTIDIFPGSGFGDRRAARIETLMPSDADALAKQPYVDSVTPSVNANVTLRYRNVDVSASIYGVGEQYFRVRGYEIAEGTAFDDDDVLRRTQVVVIDQNTKNELFGENGDALGKVVFLGSVPCRVVGVTAPRDSAFGNSDQLLLWVPYTTAMSRITGQPFLNGITVRVSDDYDTDEAEARLTALLTERHETTDFYVRNSDSIRETISETTGVMTLLISSIAVISLIVGGIGVMNIMLVSVTERTREIGVRMAVGARRRDILWQFLIEAVLVCMIGGLLGIALALGAGYAADELKLGVNLVYSTESIIAAVASSTVIGVGFGFLPARNASRLDPVEALAWE